jgi:plastocyanin
MRLTRLVVGGLALISLTCKNATSPSCTSDCVTIEDYSFAPATLTVKAGTRVTWTNAGPSAHTVTSDDGAFDSGTLAAPSGGGGYGGGSPGGVFQSTFNTPGTYTYHCAIHPPATFPNFVGTVTVTP